MLLAFRDRINDFLTGLVTLLVGFFVLWGLIGHKESEAYFEST